MNEKNTKNGTTNIAVDPDEFSIAEKKALNANNLYTHKFGTPLVYNGKSYDSLSFDFDKLSGRDLLDIENEMAKLGKTFFVQAFSGEYQIRYAAKACTENIGSDAFEIMRGVDSLKIRSKVRSFLLRTES